MINVDICKPRLLRNGRGLEKNNRGTTGAVRSDGRGQPMGHGPLAYSLRSPFGDRAAAAPNDTASRISILYMRTRWLDWSSVGQTKPIIQAPKPSARGQSLLVFWSCQLSEQGRGMRQTIRFERFPTRLHSLVQPLGARKSAACRCLPVFWVEDTLPPPVIDVNLPAGKISQITRSVGETAGQLPDGEPPCSDVHLVTPPECKSQSRWPPAWWR